MLLHRPALSKVATHIHLHRRCFTGRTATAVVVITPSMSHGRYYVPTPTTARRAAAAACYVAAACATASSSAPLHTTTAFAAAFVVPSSSTRRQNRPLTAGGAPGPFSLAYHHRHHHHHHQRQGQQRSRSISISSSVVDESATTGPPPSSSSTTANSDSNEGDVVVARGEVVHYSPPGGGGVGVGVGGMMGSPSYAVAAVRLNDEDVLANGALGGKDASSSSPGVFGAEAGKANEGTTKGGGEEQGKGDDFVGRSVIFPAGRTGVVIAERPPIAFVLCDSDLADADNDDDLDVTTAREKNSVSVLDRMATLSVSDEMTGRIVDCWGRVQGREGCGAAADAASAEEGDAASAADNAFAERAIFAPIPKVGDIALIDSPLLTGKTMVDALAPLGKGQNTLIVGADSSENRALAIDAIVTQVRMAKEAGEDGVRCVYGLTSSDPAVRADVLTRLEEAGVRDEVVLVAAREDGGGGGSEGKDDDGDDDRARVRAAADAVSVAAAACAVGEAHALSHGRDAFVVVDSIDGHKDLWDWTTRVLVDVYGVDAVVKDDRDGGASSEMRAFYSALIQRAARFNAKKGGGSVTLAMLTTLPGRMGGAESGDDEEGIVFSPEDFDKSSDKVKERIAILVKSKIPLNPANLRKIQIPVPEASESERTRRLALQHVDDLISMSDGQIWLDEHLAAAGQRPPLDPQRSITRIGIGADTASRADAPALRGLVGGLRFELAQATALEGAGAGSGADRQIRRRDGWMLAMQQGVGEGRALSDHVVALLAASMGALDGVVKEGGTAGTEAGAKAVGGLLESVRATASDAMEEIDRTLDLTEDVRSELEEAINAYFEA